MLDARRLARAALGVLLLAGVVGLARQRHEALVARRGGPSRVPGPDEPPVPQGAALARRISAWLPAPPRTPAGRLAAAVWAGPATLIGIAVGILGRGRARWDAEFGCLVFEGVRGVPAALLRGVGAGANAIGQVVISTYDDTGRRLLAHEALHVRQSERLGPLLLPLYVLLGARYGYRQNPIEHAAREAARRWTPGGPAIS